MNIIICPIVHKHHIAYSIFIQGYAKPLCLEIFDDDKVNSQKNIDAITSILNANSYNVYILINSENIKTWHNIILPSLPKSKMNAAIHNLLADDLLSNNNNYVYDKHQATILAIQSNILRRIITQLGSIKQFNIKYILPFACLLDENNGVIASYDDKNIYSFKTSKNNNVQFGGFCLLKSQHNLSATLAQGIKFLDIEKLLINNNQIWNKLNDKSNLNSTIKLNLYSELQNGASDNNLSNISIFIPKPRWLAYLVATFLVLHIIGLNTILWWQESTIKKHNSDIKQMFSKVSKDPIQDAVLQLQKMQNKQDESLQKLDLITQFLVKYNDKIKELKYSNNFWQVSFRQEPDNTIFMQEAKVYNLNLRKQGEFWVFE